MLSVPGSDRGTRPLKMPPVLEAFTGRVTNDKEKPLAGASVMINGTDVGTLTNDNGVFL